MNRKLKIAMSCIKEAVWIIIKEDKAAVRAIYLALTGFAAIPLYSQKHIAVNFQRSLKMTKKMFIFFVGILVLTFAVYIFAEDRPFSAGQWLTPEDRPIQQQRPRLQDQPPLGDGLRRMPERFSAQTSAGGWLTPVDRQVGPLRPAQMLNRWFENTKKAYHQKDKEGLDRLIHRMGNLVEQRKEAAVARPAMQAFDRWFGKFKRAYQQKDAAKMGRLIRRFEQARERIRFRQERIQNRFEHFQQDRPLLRQGDEWLERPLMPMQQLDPPAVDGGRLLPQRPFVRRQMDRQDYDRPLPQRQLRPQPRLPEEPLPAQPRPEITPKADFPQTPSPEFERD